MPISNPEKRRTYHRDYKRLKRAGSCQTPCQTPLPLEYRLRCAEDVLRLVEEQVNAVRADAEASTVEKARTVGFLAAISLRAIEAGNLHARLEALEAALKPRPLALEA